MANENSKNEGPSCACGKVDLYEEWLKQNKEDAVSTDTKPAGKDLSASDDATKQDHKPEQTSK